MRLATHCGWSILDTMALKQLDANSASLIANRWDSLEEMMSELPGYCTVSLHSVTNLWDERERRTELEITRRSKQTGEPVRPTKAAKHGPRVLPQEALGPFRSQHPAGQRGLEFAFRGTKPAESPSKAIWLIQSQGFGPGRTQEPGSCWATSEIVLRTTRSSCI